MMCWSVDVTERILAEGRLCCTLGGMEGGDSNIQYKEMPQNIFSLLGSRPNPSTFFLSLSMWVLLCILFVLLELIININQGL